MTVAIIAVVLAAPVILLPVALIAYIYGGVPLPEDITLIDMNGDNALTIDDVLEVIYYVFKGGQRPDCSPG